MVPLFQLQSEASVQGRPVTNPCQSCIINRLTEFAGELSMTPSPSPGKAYTMVTLQGMLLPSKGKLALVSAPVVTPNSSPPALTWPMPSMGVGQQLGSLGQLPGIRPWICWAPCFSLPWLLSLGQLSPGPGSLSVLSSLIPLSPVPRA